MRSSSTTGSPRRTRRSRSCSRARRRSTKRGAAGQQAVAIEPDSWRHQYRLGHASWGAARITACERAHRPVSAICVRPPRDGDGARRARRPRGRRRHRAAGRRRTGPPGTDGGPISGDRISLAARHAAIGARRRVRRDRRVRSRVRPGAIRDGCTDPNTPPRRSSHAATSELALGQVDRARATFTAALDQIAGYARALVGLSLVEAAFGRRGRGPIRAGGDARGRSEPRAAPAARTRRCWSARRMPPATAMRRRPSSCWNAPAPPARRASSAGACR